MKSPFPGMDPYLEQHWRDVHHNLITFLQGALNEQLPEGLIARVEERVFLESEEGSGRSMYPDARVVERGPAPATRAPDSNLAVAEPLTIPLPSMEPLTEGFILIVDVSSGNRVVTVIEVLSLSNKTPGDGQTLYQQKQREVLHSDANLVEIDLLRGGQRILAVPPDRWPAEHQSPYAICVRRCNERAAAKVYPITLFERLPRFALPLRVTDADLALDMQPLVDQCYRNGRYGMTINYKVDPEPPLGPAEAQWLDALLKAAGKR
jgi:hypothetical protein